MSENQPRGEKPQEGRAIAVRERLITQSPVAIWDSGSFEHMGRVAATMAESGLMSETFLKDGDEAAGPKAVVARCLLVASIARECGANPLVFLQHCSVIGRKLHFEGKLVNAIVRARTGVELAYRFGLWNTDHIEFAPLVPLLGPDGKPVELDGEPVMVPDESFLHGAGERLAIRCWDPDRPERFVDGSAGMWKTDRKGSPWTSPNNWRRQLRYRAVPEWARAYEPGAILGINVDGEDDGDDFTIVKPARVKTDLRSRLPAPGGEGFDEERIARETGGEAPQNSQEGGEVGQGSDAHPTSEGAATATAGAQAAGAEPASSAAAPNASAPGQAERSSHQPSSRPRTDGITEGYPLQDEVYHLEGEGADEGGKRPTYKNGERFSSAGPKARLKTYADHHADFQDGPAPGSSDWPKEEEVEEEEEAQDAEFAEVGEPADDEFDAEAEYADLPPEFAAYARATDTAESFDEVKVAMRTFFAGAEFKAMSAAQQNNIRKNTWETLIERKVKAPDHAADPTSFRLWIEAQEDPEAISGTLAALERVEGLPDAILEACRSAAGLRIELLRQG